MRDPSPSGEKAPRWRDDEKDLLDRATHGVLALGRAGRAPLLRPLNFVRIGSRIYVHGAPEGAKMEALAANSAVSFLVVRDYSIIPSHFIHPENACPATQYYAAILLEGQLREVVDLEEKALGLQSLMQKLQPDGGYETIQADSDRYQKALRTTAVLCLDVEWVSSKFNFGQDARGAKRRGIEEGLESRGQDPDPKTLKIMRTTALEREIVEGPRVCDPRGDPADEDDG